MDLLNYIVLFLRCHGRGGGECRGGRRHATELSCAALALGDSIAANATNTVALWPGSLSSFWGYRSELGQGSRREFLVLSVPSFLGGILGAVLLVKTSSATFDVLVPWLILSATLLFVVQGPLARWQRWRTPFGPQSESLEDQAMAPSEASDAGGPGPSAEQDAAARPPASRVRWIVVLVFQFLIGVYGGYFGAGIGILMLAALGFLGFKNIHHMNALKNLNNLCINGMAAALFIAKGLVQWQVAPLMIIGSIIGGYAGAGTARRIGQNNVRRVIIAIGLTLSIGLLVRSW